MCDGVEVISDIGTRFGPTTSTRNYVVGSTSDNGPGAVGNAHNGGIGDALLVSGTSAMSAAEKLQTRKYFAAEHGVSL